MTAQIQSIFPTPVVSNNFSKDFTSKEKEFIKLHESKVITSDLNNISKDKYVLNYPEMSRIKQFIEKNIDFYLKNVIVARQGASLRITQSWLNYTETGRQHHAHSHPNSYISGVFYFNADPELDRIYFLKQDYKQLLMYSKDFNYWNSSSWWLPVGTGELLLFPSHLVHMVRPTKSKETRISLAFNTFPVGNLGDEVDADALYLKE